MVTIKCEKVYIMSLVAIILYHRVSYEVMSKMAPEGFHRNHCIYNRIVFLSLKESLTHIKLISSK